MNLRETIEFVRSLEKELALFNLDLTDPIPTDLSTFFRTQNVEITVNETSSTTPEEIAVLSTADEVLEVLDVETLRELVAQSPATEGTVGISDERYEAVLTHLKETTFTSYENEEMLYASREIEDRARRRGKGTIHAGFQRCSHMGKQRAIYRDLARRDLEVHAYGVPDVAPPDLGDARVHTVGSEEIAETWFVVFDGGGEPTLKSALLAEERASGAFYGAWTYDATIVDTVCEYLDGTDSAASESVHQPGT